LPTERILCIWSIFCDSWRHEISLQRIIQQNIIWGSSTLDNTSTPFFNGVRRSGWPHNCGQLCLYYPASLCHG